MSYKKVEVKPYSPCKNKSSGDFIRLMLQVSPKNFRADSLFGSGRDSIKLSFSRLWGNRGYRITCTTKNTEAFSAVHFIRDFDSKEKGLKVLNLVVNSGFLTGETLLSNLILPEKVEDWGVLSTGVRFNQDLAIHESFMSRHRMLLSDESLSTQLVKFDEDEAIEIEKEVVKLQAKLKSEFDANSVGGVIREYLVTENNANNGAVSKVSYPTESVGKRVAVTSR